MSDPPHPEAVELTREEGRELFDSAARREFGISGEEFVRRYDAGEEPYRWHTEMLLLMPFMREVKAS